ncbi:hypothetical protein RAMDARK_0946 [Rickettsia amblyommatis str. Darkwater]|nr:hypothetical protein RAMDARK_0946 [Rickettsia amblyommatis str. Darkwater]
METVDKAKIILAVLKRLKTGKCFRKIGIAGLALRKNNITND